MSDLDAMMQAVDAANPDAEPVTAGDVLDNDTGKPVKSDKPADGVLELTEDDEAVEVGDDEEGGEESQDADGKRRRHKPVSARLAEERWKRGEVERELAALRAKYEAPEPAPAPEKPDPSQFEFGEADPAYIKADLRYDMALEKAEADKVEESTRAHREMVDNITSGVVKAEEAAKAKYDDFDDRIADAVEARGGEALPPLLTIGISVSPVGHDILYRLATDEAASARLEKLAKGGAASANATAMALGELEGEYLDDDSDSDLDLTDNLDMARMMGRMRARLKGAKAPAPKQAEIAVTNAPEPPAQRARGSSSRTRVSGDTEDTAAFYRDFGKEIGIR